MVWSDMGPSATWDAVQGCALPSAGLWHGEQRDSVDGVYTVVMELSPFFYEQVHSARIDLERGLINEAGYLRRLDLAAEAERRIYEPPTPFMPRFPLSPDATLEIGMEDNPCLDGSHASSPSLALWI